MTARREIRWDRIEEAFFVPSLVEKHESPAGFEFTTGGHVACESSDQAFGPRAVIKDVGLSSLRQALLRAHRFHMGEEIGKADLFEVTVSVSEDDYDEDYSAVSPHSIVLRADGSLVLHTVLTSDPQAAEVARFPEMFGGERAEATWHEGPSLAADWVAARGHTLLSFEPAEVEPHYDDLYEATILLSRRGRTVGEVITMAEDLETYMASVSAPDGENLTALWGLVRTGNSHVLIGTPEGDRLEAKGFFKIDSDLDEVEYAKDVSAFANSTSGGLIIYGVRTRANKSGDVVHSIHPFKKDGQDRKLRRIIESRVFPPIEGLAVQFVGAARSSESLLAVLIPPQPAELRPFLVRGGIVGGKSKGSFIGVFRRRGEDVRAMSPEGIHSALAAGMALLRGASAGGDVGESVGDS